MKNWGYPASDMSKPIILCAGYPPNILDINYNKQAISYYQWSIIQNFRTRCGTGQIKPSVKYLSEFVTPAYYGMPSKCSIIHRWTSFHLFDWDLYTATDEKQKNNFFAKLNQKEISQNFNDLQQKRNIFSRQMRK